MGTPNHLAGYHWSRDWAIVKGVLADLGSHFTIGSFQSSCRDLSRTNCAVTAGDFVHAFGNHLALRARFSRSYVPARTLHAAAAVTKAWLLPWKVPLCSLRPSSVFRVARLWRRVAKMLIDFDSVIMSA